MSRRPAPFERFRGEICGLGTASGTRIVVGRWAESPFGSFTDVMVERGDGHRVFLAPDDVVAAYVTSVYAFDEIMVTPVVAERGPDTLHVTGGPLVVDAGIGGRDPLGWLLHAVPSRLAASTTWASVVDPIARVAMRGVRTRGTTAGGEEYYAATDSHAVTAVAASWDGVDLGALTDVDPPVRFGFSSTPRRPTVVAVTTTVRRR